MDDGEFYRKRARRRLWVLCVIAAVAAVGAWYLFHSDSFQKVAALESSVERIAVQEISKSFQAPPPLIVTGAGASAGAESATLTRAGIIADTNAARAANGNLPPLAENQTLDDIAQIRLDDMFAKQYFAHLSPSSSSAVTVAQAVGYGYIALGENLALGNFAGDEGVITTWMGSPGHRANILDAHYTQIGAAARAGKFQGDDAWIAVQVFGKPLSDCPLPDAALKTQIISEQNQITAMQAQLQLMKAQIDAMDPSSGDAYSQVVNAYNVEVSAYDDANA